ncbi:acyl-CoA dehydrogenase family protein [Streptomyces sp. NPDC051129]|uniref:acyl-CoA dehydrogenase family protein n=1 Tax=Streptomyces sp. NPDC051129 TaxID=3154639 RepID=UPI0034253B9B
MVQQRPAQPRNFSSDPDRPSFLEELYQGRFRWDLVHPFAEQDAADRAAGDQAVAGLGAFLREHVDPAEVEASGRLPDSLYPLLRSRGYLSLQLDPSLGGLGLSHFNVFRVVQAAASHCFPVALVMGIENSVGTPAFWPVVADGPLKDLLHRHQKLGGLSGTADTEPGGAANQHRATTAVPVDGGSAYVLDGHKIFVGHAPLGTLFSVTATVRENGTVTNQVFFVEADTPGFSRGQWHEFSGIRGFPNGWITLDKVRVPAEHRLLEEGNGQARLTPAVSRLVTRGRLHMIVAPSLAVAKLCCRWSREFVKRRVVDGRPLGEYEEIQRRLADTLAETFAVESVARAALLNEDQDLGRNTAFEQNVAKNIASVVAGRVADRTLSLLAAEGYETAASKKRRGAPALPVEQAVRDVRNMRISGGVDFLIDYWLAGRNILSYYYPEPDEPQAPAAPDASLLDADLTDRNRAHLAAVAEETHRFGLTCRELARRHPDRSALAARQRVLVLLSRISAELFTMAVVLARASGMTRTAAPAAEDGQHLADLYCEAARHRVAGHLRQLRDAASDEEGADYAGQSTGWLSAAGPHPLSEDLL